MGVSFGAGTGNSDLVITALKIWTHTRTNLNSRRVSGMSLPAWRHSVGSLKTVCQWSGSLRLRTAVARRPGLAPGGFKPAGLRHKDATELRLEHTEREPRASPPGGPTELRPLVH
jgi:hypothetical protein